MRRSAAFLFGAFVSVAAACSQRYGAEDVQPVDRVDGAADATDAPSVDGGGTSDGPNVLPDGAVVDGNVPPTFSCVMSATRICLDFEDNTLGAAQGFGVKATGASIASSSRARTGSVGASARATSLQGGRVILGKALPLGTSKVRMSVHVYLESPAASYDLFAVQADDGEGPLMYMASVRSGQLVLYNGRGVEPGGTLTTPPADRWLNVVLEVDFGGGTVTLERDKTLVQSSTTKASPTQIALVIGPTIIDSGSGTYSYDDIQIDF